MHRYSAKVRSIFSVLASILLLILLVLLAACSDISGKDSTSGSVSFSFDSNFLRSVNSRAAEYTGGGINKSEDGAEETKEYTVQFEVNILGDYTDSKTVEWKTQNYPNVHPAHQDIHNQEGESEKIEYPEQKVTFENIAVGKTVYAQVNVYVIYSDYSGETQKELIMNGKSVTKTITEGENTLPVSVSSIYKMFPVSINLTFEKDTPSNAGDFGLISVYAFKKDSDILAKICKLCANEDDEAALEAIHYSSDSDGKVEPAFWYAADNVDVSENKAEYADGVFTLTGKMELVRDEELVFVALINYEGGTNGITYLGHVDANASNLEAVKSKAIVPNADGTNVELKLYRMDTVTSLYALYNKNSGIYQFYPTYESAISSAPYGTPIESSTGSFAFDDAGNFYVLDNSSGYKILSSNQKIPETGVTIDSVWYGDYKPYITVDKKTNILYGGYSQGTGGLELRKFPSLISSGNVSDVKSVADVACSTGSYLCHEGAPFVVHDGMIYAICKYNTTTDEQYKLAIYDSNNLTETDGQYPLPAAELVSLELTGLNLSNSSTFTDMIYQDGAVYMLLRDYRIEAYDKDRDAYFRSRGALIKYDVKTKSITKLGWTDNDNKVNLSSGKLYLYYGEGHQLYEDSNKTIPLIIDRATAEDEHYNEGGHPFDRTDIYIPQLSSTTQLFGPQRFIAIKPKKLVIADDGVAYYTDSNGAWKYKNVDRIVTVDLNDFIISPESTDLTGIKFNSDEENTPMYLTSSGYNAKVGSNYTANSVYYSSTNGKWIYPQPGIPWGDE